MTKIGMKQKDGKDRSCKYWLEGRKPGYIMSDKVDFEAKKIIRDRNGHYTMTTGSIHQED